MSILVVGSVAFDTLSTPYGKVEKVLGGSATHFSLSASYFTDVNLIACVGQDFPQKYYNIFKKHNINTNGLEKLDGKTFSWTGKYEDDLSNAQTISTELNVFETFNPTLDTTMKKSKVVFLANIHPQIQLNILSQLTKPKIVACDTMNLWIETQKKSLVKLLKNIDIFFINEGEAKLLSNESNILIAAKSILALGPEIVVIKKGEHGACLFANKWYFTVPAYLVETPKDPTGAGDSFAGGFMGYLAHVNSITKQSLCEALVYGTTMASFNVEDFSVNKVTSLNVKKISSRKNALRKTSAIL